MSKILVLNAGSSSLKYANMRCLKEGNLPLKVFYHLVSYQE